MAKCDLCGSNCPAKELVTLSQDLQVNEVRDICPKCARWASELNRKLLSEVSNSMKAAIVNRFGAVDDPWWVRAIRAISMSRY